MGVSQHDVWTPDDRTACGTFWLALLFIHNSSLVRACNCRDYHVQEAVHQGHSSKAIVAFAGFLTKDGEDTLKEYGADVEN